MRPFRRGRGCAAGLGGRRCSPASWVPRSCPPPPRAGCRNGYFWSPWPLVPPCRPAVLVGAAAGSGSSPSPALLPAGLNWEQRALPPGPGSTLGGWAGAGTVPLVQHVSLKGFSPLQGALCPVPLGPSAHKGVGGSGLPLPVGVGSPNGDWVVWQPWQGGCCPRLVLVERLGSLLGFSFGAATASFLSLCHAGTLFYLPPSISSSIKLRLKLYL